MGCRVRRPAAPADRDRDDLDLPPGGARRGLLVVASLTKEAPEVPLLVVAPPELEEMAERVVRAGARRLLSKLDADGLAAAVRAEHDAFLQAAYSGRLLNEEPGTPASDEDAPYGR
jgi:hypothetical protein